MDFKKLIADNVNFKGLIIEGILDGVVKAKLDELVLASDNSLDDALVAMIYPEIKKAAEKYVEDLVAKLLAE